MRNTPTKANADLEFFNARLDEIQMGGYERLKAKAQLARAEAVAEALYLAATGIARLYRSLARRSALDQMPPRQRGERALD